MSLTNLYIILRHDGLRHSGSDIYLFSHVRHWFASWARINARQPIWTGGRVAGLDAWRGGLLAGFGVLVHCADHIHDQPLWAKIITVTSHAFRMEAFFTIAGFLAAMSYTKKRHIWLARRAISLMVPFAFVAGIFMPIVNAIEGTNQFILFHLWFLPTLMICSLFPPFRIATEIIAVGAIVGLMIERALLVSTQLDAMQPVFSSVYYVAFYILGQQFYIRQVRAPRLWIGLSILFAMVAARIVSPALFEASTRNVSVKILVLGVQAVTAFTVSMAVTRHALEMATVGPIAHKMANASYTIYLMHFPILCLCFAATGQTGFVQFGVIAVITFTTCLIIHFGIVARYKWAAFLLNGKISSKLFFMVR